MQTNISTTRAGARSLNEKGLLRRMLDNKVAYFMIFPSVLFLAVFTIYPLIWAVVYSFFDYDGYRSATFVGLDNYIRALADPNVNKEFYSSILNTFIYAAGKLVLTIPLAFLLAVILNGKIRGKSTIRAAIFLPTVISTAVMSLIFYFIFNPLGVLNKLLFTLHIIPRQDSINWLGKDLAMVSAVILAAWGAIGNNMLYFVSGMQSIPKELYESADMDGANKWQQTLHITIPMLGPVMQIVIMLAILAALKGYESIMVLTAGGPAGKTEVMFLYVYRLLFPFSESGASTMNIGYGSAVAILCAVVVGIITMIYLRMSKKMDEIF